jgi:hypothetical protein
MYSLCVRMRDGKQLHQKQLGKRLSKPDPGAQQILHTCLCSSIFCLFPSSVSVQCYDSRISYYFLSLAPRTREM